MNSPAELTMLTVRDAQDQARLRAQLDAGAILVDSARRRPFYFDGRFLSADDLTADQNYIRARQSDLAQAMGAGVVRGLMVGLGRQAASQQPTLLLEPGIGLTPGGDIVTVGARQELAISALAGKAELDAQLGIKQLPGAGASNRSGLFVLALRPIEFSANPTTAYPTSLDGQRLVRDGDIVEATAVTLIPYPDRAGVENAAARRARVAREIFFEGQRPGALQDALPLAMLCLEGGALRWLDVFMVRREVGAESTLAAGLAPRPRALLEAWLKQHQDQLDDIATPEIQTGFAAARQFEVLPPVGPLPAACLRFETQLGQLTLLQSYFPPLVDCEFAFIPADELAALVQEALALPPIDLRAADEDLDHLSVLIVAPVTRQQLEQHRRSLQSLSRPVKSASAGLIAKRSPLEALLQIGRGDGLPPGLLAPAPVDAAKAWQRAIEASRSELAAADGRPMFWYLRRRQLPYSSELSSATLRLAGDAASIDVELDLRLRADRELERFASINSKMPLLARAELGNLLAAPRLAVSEGVANKQLLTSDLLRRSAFTAVSARAELRAKNEEALRHDDVLEIARQFGDPRLGEGFDALAQAADPETRDSLRSPALVQAVADSGVAPALDRAARALPPLKQADFAARLREAALSDDAAQRLAQLAGEIARG
ncbi:hypothetical protein [Paucibacter sp. M5-1]|uniref:hypothetical protein n=1 Tax=Paucibacter sp. M5-1 TaxID=3015998 RepID=UPI0022B875D1|nr:hypothetical protein [Paucibacter sp. M5-1]MCZ7884702.1 hypothetical protein [Paucibacter sp. M5-1]